MIEVGLMTVASIRVEPIQALNQTRWFRVIKIELTDDSLIELYMQADAEIKLALEEVPNA